MSFKSEQSSHQEWPDWVVSNDTDILQTDGCSCGPIKCAKVMEVFGILEPDAMATIEDYPGGYHAVAMEYYQWLVMKYDKDLFLPLRKKPAKTRLFIDCLKGNQEYKEDDKSSGNENSSASLLEHVSVTRSVALDKKNKRQATSAEKEMKRAGEAASRNGVAPGAVVTLKVDYRTHSHAQGLMGIVFDSKPTGGIKVCCDH